MTYAIRRYQQPDAAAIAEIFHAAIETLATTHYNADQIAVWTKTGQDATVTHARCTDGRHVWVAADQSNTAAAFIEVEDGHHIDRLYCHPDHASRGLATRLYQALELHARSAGTKSLYTEASAIARPAFEKWDFNTLHRRDFLLDGVQVFNFAMEKALS